MTVIDKARELGVMIQQDERYAATMLQRTLMIMMKLFRI